MEEEMTGEGKTEEERTETKETKELGGWRKVEDGENAEK